jgi:hypothetical protein
VQVEVELAAHAAEPADIDDAAETFAASGSGWRRFAET